MIGMDNLSLPPPPLFSFSLSLPPSLPPSLSLSLSLSLQGASKNGKAPDGSSYLDCAESDEVKALLKWPLLDPTPLTHQRGQQKSTCMQNIRNTLSPVLLNMHSAFWY